MTCRQMRGARLRLFLAINPSVAIRARIEETVTRLRADAPELRWVATDRVHLTVRFLGEVDPSGVAGIQNAIDAAVAQHADAPITLDRVGAFPSFRRARVLWIGVEPHPRLELLHHDVEGACVALGFEPEGRPFRPHLTVARVHDGTSVDTLRALARAARRVRLSETMNVESVDLMVSETTPIGSRYRLLHTSSLRTAA